MGKLDPTMQDKWWRSVIAREEALSHKEGTLVTSKVPKRESNLTVASLMRWTSHEKKKPAPEKSEKAGSQHDSQASLPNFKGDKEEASSLASAARSIAKSHVSYPKTPQLSQAGSNTEVEELIEAKQIDDFLGTKQELNLEE
jgi:hypothetical protein